ncbi:uncharacterized protein LOC112590737 [Harpegnathos saltator]|uniref:uncharacterized protein LOC112590737 n=1 Tax=Harpegnathos saltator TaxID=610380 RepID=UPI000DBED47A|nr:uncharacterized protein LOC112590737 [Harpegnathos saltator]
MQTTIYIYLLILHKTYHRAHTHIISHTLLPQHLSTQHKTHRFILLTLHVHLTKMNTCTTLMIYILSCRVLRAHGQRRGTRSIRFHQERLSYEQYEERLSYGQHARITQKADNQENNDRWERMEKRLTKMASVASTFRVPNTDARRSSDSEGTTPPQRT